MGKNDCKLTKEQNKKLNYILFVNFYYSISLVRLQWKTIYITDSRGQEKEVVVRAAARQWLH